MAVMEEMGTGSTWGGRVTQRVNCCSGNRLWQKPPAGSSGLFMAQPKVFRLKMSMETQEQEEVKEDDAATPSSMMATEVKSLKGKTQERSGNKGRDVRKE